MGMNQHPPAVNKIFLELSGFCSLIDWMVDYAVFQSGPEKWIF